MFGIAVFFAFLAACSAHLVHGPVLAPVPVTPYLHGYGHGLLDYGHGLGHGYINPVAHHLLKRSPHFAPVGHLDGLGHVGGIGHLGGLGHLGGIGHLGGVGHLGVGHVAPIAHVTPVAAVAPVAVSHQSRVDIRHSPALVAAPVVPVVKPIVTPLFHAGLPYGAGHYEIGHYGSAYPHLGHH